MLKSLLLETHGVVAYATVFGVLIACGLGIPLPEDISLILGGYLSHHGAASLPGMMVVGFLGILGGDSIIYLAGRRLGSKVGQKPGGFFARIVTPEKRAHVQRLFARHGPKVRSAPRTHAGTCASSSRGLRGAAARPFRHPWLWTPNLSSANWSPTPSGTPPAPVG